MFVVATTRRNASPSLILELLLRVARVIKDYCGVLTEDALRKNAILVYELLDEMLDHGYAQSTNTDSLKHRVHNEPAPLPVGNADGAHAGSPANARRTGGRAVSGGGRNDGGEREERARGSAARGVPRTRPRGALAAQAREGRRDAHAARLHVHPGAARAEHKERVRAGEFIVRRPVAQRVATEGSVLDHRRRRRAEETSGGRSERRAAQVGAVRHEEQQLRRARVTVVCFERRSRARRATTTKSRLCVP